ncbi:MAG: transcription antitermination factor NusB [Acidimicrobiales bacterium]
MGELGTQRHQARERALEILYEATIKDRPVAQIIQNLALAPDPYTVAVLLGTEEHRARAEELIVRHLQDWTLERLALIDRLILTMAIGELLLDDPPPTAVVLDEAVELAKVYSTDGSASFVNGVLAACAADLK